MLRNFSTLLATTMFSIYTMLWRPEKRYPKQIEGKLEAMDFDLVLESSLPFQYFYDFVNNNAVFYKPYLEVYVLGRLYQE